MHQAEAVAQPLGLVETVRRHDDRASLLPQLADVIENRLAAEDVEAARRLVEQHDGRVMNQGAGQLHALPLAGAQRGTPLVEKRAEIHQLAQLAEPLFGPIGIESVQVGEEEQHLARREPLVEPGTRGDEADAAFHLVGEFGRAESLDLGITAGRRQQAENHADGRRLARAIGPEQAENFARTDAKREMIDRHNLAGDGWTNVLVSSWTEIISLVELVAVPVSAAIAVLER